MTTDSALPNPQPTAQKPNDLLATQVTDALVAAGCITEGHKTELLAKLKTGGVTQEDWYLWVDLATAPQVAAEEAGNE